jgi:hypothetical protein
MPIAIKIIAKIGAKGSITIRLVKTIRLGIERKFQSQLEGK